MNVEEITLVMDTTKILKDMCFNNYEHTRNINKELQKLVKVIMTIEARVKKLENA